MSNMGGEVGYVLLIPLAGDDLPGRRAPSARRPRGGIRGRLGRLQRQPAARHGRSAAGRAVGGSGAHHRSRYHVNPSANYYFMFVSTFLITALGTLVTERVVAPRLGRLRRPGRHGRRTATTLTPRGAPRAVVGRAATAALMAALILLGARCPRRLPARSRRPASLLALAVHVAASSRSSSSPALVVGPRLRHRRADAPQRHRRHRRHGRSDGDAGRSTSCSCSSRRSSSRSSTGRTSG